MDRAHSSVPAAPPRLKRTSSSPPFRRLRAAGIGARSGPLVLLSGIANEPGRSRAASRRPACERIRRPELLAQLEILLVTTSGAVTEAVVRHPDHPVNWATHGSSKALRDGCRSRRGSASRLVGVPGIVPSSGPSRGLCSTTWGCRAPVPVVPASRSSGRRLVSAGGPAPLSEGGSASST